MREEPYTPDEYAAYLKVLRANVSSKGGKAVHRGKTKEELSAMGKRIRRIGIERKANSLTGQAGHDTIGT